MENTNDWTDLDPQFTEKAYKGESLQYKEGTWQQLWEVAGISYSEAQQWIKYGFEVKDINQRHRLDLWKKYGISVAQHWEWRKKGLSKGDHQLAAYAQWRGYQPDSINVVNQLKKITIDIKDWLNVIYPVNERINTTEIDSSFLCYNQLTGKLIINGLEWLNLKEIKIRNNQLTGDLITFSQLVNLEKLDISYNNFSGSLAPLANLVKLEKLNISNNEFDSSLEYLPESVKTFECNQFSELENYLEFNNYYNYQSWKKANRELTTNCLPIQPLSQQIQSLLALNKSFLTQEKAYEQMTRKIQAANYAQYCSLTIGAAGSILSAYETIPGGYLTGSAGFLGTFITYQLNEHWKAQLATLKQRSEGHQQASKAQFITAVSQLEKSYHKLVNLHTKLAVFDFTIISSSRTALRSLIEQFLSSFATLKEELEQQDSFRADLEIGWRTTTEARNYFEFFQQHWTQLAMKKVSSQLVTELTAYHAVLIKGTDSDSETEIASESDDFSDDLQQLFLISN